jgi:beta-N-acetylhexosaminidase
MSGRIRYLRLTLLVIAAAVIASSCGKNGRETTGPKGSWTDETFSKMSNEQKVGQLFCMTIDPVGYYINPEYQRSIRGLVEKCLPGAVYFVTDVNKYTRENINEFDGVKTREVVLDLERIVGAPLLVSADFENGAWFWDKRATRFSAPIALGATGSPSLAYRAGKITANEALAQGINWLFAPVGSTIEGCGVRFGARSYGSEPDSAAQYVSQFIRGTVDAGAASCLTFIPGTDGASELQGGSKPIASGIAAGVQSIMTAPVPVPEGADRTVFAASSPKTGLASGYGFKGIVVHGLVGNGGWTPGEEGVNTLIQSFAAAQDMLILPDDPARIEPYLDFLFLRVRAKKLDPGPAVNSIKRILSLKEELGLNKIRKNPDEAMSGIGIREYRLTAEDISRASLTLLKNDGGMIPLNVKKLSVLFVNISDSTSTPEASLFSANLAQNHPEINQISLLGSTDDRDAIEVLRRAKESDAVVCTFFLAPEPEQPESQPDRDTVSLLRRLVAVNRNCACISFEGPCLITRLPEVKAFLAAYSHTTHDTDGALGALFGEYGISGRLPFPVSERYPVGFGLRTPGPSAR